MGQRLEDLVVTHSSWPKGKTKSATEVQVVNPEDDGGPYSNGCVRRRNGIKISSYWDILKIREQQQSV